jgi:nitrogen fixation-related uncharacterized protein
MARRLFIVPISSVVLAVFLTVVMWTVLISTSVAIFPCTVKRWDYRRATPGFTDPASATCRLRDFSDPPHYTVMEWTRAGRMVEFLTVILLPAVLSIGIGCGILLFMSLRQPRHADTRQPAQERLRDD